MKVKSILSGLTMVCAACMFLAASCSQASNRATEEIPIITVSVRYVVDDVDAAVEFYTKLTELVSVSYLVDDARVAVDLYTTHLLGFVVDFYRTRLAFAVYAQAGPMTAGRARATVAAVVGLISVVIGALALARAAGRLGTGNGRVGATVALVLGLIGMVLSVVHLGSSTGGFGTGGGRAGAIVGLVLGLIGMNLGGLALARSRRKAGAGNVVD